MSNFLLVGAILLGCWFPLLWIRVVIAGNDAILPARAWRWIGFAAISHLLTLLTLFVAVAYPA